MENSPHYSSCLHKIHYTQNQLTNDSFSNNFPSRKHFLALPLLLKLDMKNMLPEFLFVWYEESLVKRACDLFIFLSWTDPKAI